MIKRTAYFKFLLCLNIRHGRILLLLLMLFLVLHVPARGLENPNVENGTGKPDNPVFDEVSLTLNVTRIGSIEISAVIMGQDAYLPVKEIFDFLKIKAIISAEADTLSGFIIHPDAVFYFDKAKHQLFYQGKITDLKTSDLLVTEKDFYLKAEYFSLFGLDCSFSFRSLSVSLTARIELPAIREMQMEQMRRNISSLMGNKKADTIIARKFQLLKMGFADWALNGFEQYGTNSSIIANINMALILAGGETNINFNFNSSQPFNKKNSQYKWRYVNNDGAIIKQVIIGKFVPSTTASLLAPITGFQISNAPTRYRKSFGNYTISNTTKPGWMVELYVNNVLVNYVKADASGFYTFDVPVLYGTSAIKLRFYGPWGEEETKEEIVNIPFNFLPLNKFEYNLSGGMVNDEEKSRFSRASLGYGLTNRVTVSAGLEYLSSVVLGKTMPFLNSSVRLGSGMLFSLDKSFGVRTKSVFSYRNPSNLQFELNYTKFDKEQTAVRFTFYDEKKLMFSMPIKSGKFSGYTRFNITQNGTSKLKYTTAEWMMTGAYKGMSANLTNAMFKSSNYSNEFYSNLSLNFRIPGGIRINPQVQYNYSIKQVSSVRTSIDRKVFKKGFATVSWEKNLRFNFQNINVGLRFNFSYASISKNIRFSKNQVAYSQTARGSLLFNDYSDRLSFSNVSQAGRAAIVIVPFVDINCNGIRDANEPKAYGLNLRMSGGKVTKDKKDTTITISGLEAYNDYFIELDKMSFDHVAWQITKPVIKVTAEPNYYKEIQIPVSVVGEISGTVSDYKDGEEKGIGRLIVNIKNADGKLVAKVLSEKDGFFIYMGLKPGIYSVGLDTEQMKKLDMIALGALQFEIKTSFDGDIVDGLELRLQSNH